MIRSCQFSGRVSELHDCREGDEIHVLISDRCGGEMEEADTEATIHILFLTSPNVQAVLGR